MPAELTFLGAARNVTGSRYFLKTASGKLFIDCGLFQERDFLHRNWEPFNVDPATLDAVLLTHAHLDHCGLIPRLVQGGFDKRIYCTPGTAEIAGISLQDAAKMQEEDAIFKKRRHEREGRTGPYPEVPLYTSKDVERTIPLFSPVEYGKNLRVAADLDATYLNAGHVLGAAMIKLNLHSPGKPESILFSGDIGRWKDPILYAPAIVDSADYVIMDATYGGTLHESEEQAAIRLATIINETSKAGGNIIIPSFVFERAQDLLYYIGEFLRAGQIPKLPVFLDSPMATTITSVFSHSSLDLNDNIRRIISSGHSPFEFSGLTLVTSVDQSKSINLIKGPSIIIAGSGMATGGRIKNHLVNNITRPENTIVFVGYQAANTLGRQITDGNNQVRILGENYPVRARIEKIDGFSAHADNDELLKWLKGFKQSPRRVFIVHSEPAGADKFAQLVSQEFGWNVEVPQYGETLQI